MWRSGSIAEEMSNEYIAAPGMSNEYIAAAGMLLLALFRAMDEDAQDHSRMEASIKCSLTREASHTYI